MKYLISIIIVIFQIKMQAQPVTSPFIGDGLRNVMLASTQNTYTQVGTYKVVGSPFFMEKKFKGTVYMEDGNVVNDGQISYNMYNHRIVYSNGKDSGEISDPVKYFSLKYNDRDLVFVSTDSIHSNKKGYFFELNAGKNAIFYKYNYCQLAEHPSFFSPDWRVFEPVYEYYISVKGEAPKRLKITKKDILKHLGNSEKIEKYIDDQKIDFSMELDIIKLFAYANTL